MNFEKLDEILQEVRGQLMEQARTQKIEILDESIWRWDQPEFRISWISNDTAKNVVLYVDPNDHRITIECNAWLDARTGNSFLRLWKHEEIGKYNRNDKEGLWVAIEKAIFNAQCCRPSDLNRRKMVK